MKDFIRVAIIQPKPYPSFDDPRNIGHAMQLLERCSGEELDVICFPEYFPFLGEREIGAAARKYNSYIIAGYANLRSYIDSLFFKSMSVPYFIEKWDK